MGVKSAGNMALEIIVPAESWVCQGEATVDDNPVWVI